MARGRMRPVDIEDERGDCHRQVIRLPRQPECRWSEEASYGVHRRLQGWPHKWRVSYVRATGEIYAVDQGLRLHNAVDRTLAYGPLYVIGHVEPDPVPEGDRKSLYYATLEQIRDGWAERCWTPDGLIWLRDRLAEVR